jgi:hypothetical protein
MSSIARGSVPDSDPNPDPDPGLPDPDPLVIGMDPDPDPDPSIIFEKGCKCTFKNNKQKIAGSGSRIRIH